MNEFKQVQGVTEAKAKKYGQQIIQFINKWLKEKNVKPRGRFEDVRFHYECQFYFFFRMKFRI